MPPRFIVVGADVLFAHWRVDPAAVDAAIPDDLTVDTFDGSAWVSALALENRSVSPGGRRLPRPLERGIPQLNFRTYVTRDGDGGVCFLSLDTGLGAAALAGSGVFGLPVNRARMRLTRRGGRTTFRSRRDGAGARRPSSRLGTGRKATRTVRSPGASRSSVSSATGASSRLRRPAEWAGADGTE